MSLLLLVADAAIATRAVREIEGAFISFVLLFVSSGSLMVRWPSGPRKPTQLELWLHRIGFFVVPLILYGFIFRGAVLLPVALIAVSRGNPVENVWESAGAFSLLIAYYILCIRSTAGFHRVAGPTRADLLGGT